MTQVERRTTPPPSQPVTTGLLDADTAAWMQRVDLLVTCLCMGGRHYVAEYGKSWLVPGAKAEPHQVKTMHGKTITVMMRPEAYATNETERQILADSSDAARAVLSEQLDIPVTSWHALSLRIMATPNALDFLIKANLLPPRPRK